MYDTGINIYFDCEFTGLRKDTDLISIGLVTDDDMTFYAEFTDYDRTKLNSWIKDNVISNLTKPELDLDPKHVRVTASRERVSKLLINWLNRVREDHKVQFISDCASYDSVLLFDLLSEGKDALNIPEWVQPIVFDIVYLISGSIDFDIGTSDTIIKKYIFTSTYEADMRDYLALAFDISREELLKKLNGDTFSIDGKKHNSLYDAKVIKAIYDSICGIYL